MKTAELKSLKNNKPGSGGNALNPKVREVKAGGPLSSRSAESTESSEHLGLHRNPVWKKTNYKKPKRAEYVSQQDLSQRCPSESIPSTHNEDLRRGMYLCGDSKPSLGPNIERPSQTKSVMCCVLEE